MVDHPVTLVAAGLATAFLLTRSRSASATPLLPRVTPSTSPSGSTSSPRLSFGPCAIAGSREDIVALQRELNRWRDAVRQAVANAGVVSLPSAIPFEALSVDGAAGATTHRTYDLVATLGNQVVSGIAFSATVPHRESCGGGSASARQLASAVRNNTSSIALSTTAQRRVVSTLSRR